MLDQETPILTIVIWTKVQILKATLTITLSKITIGEQCWVAKLC